MIAGGQVACVADARRGKRRGLTASRSSARLISPIPLPLLAPATRPRGAGSLLEFRVRVAEPRKQEYCDDLLSISITSPGDQNTTYPDNEKNKESPSTV